MIQRRLLISSLMCASLVTGCSDSSGSDDSGGEDDGFNTMVPSGSSSGETDSSTTADGTDSLDTTTSTGDGDSDSGDGDTDGPCESNDDCPEGEICDPEDMMCIPDCGTAMVTLEAKPPAVMLVLDKSGSMVNNTWDHDGDPGTAEETRWATLHTVADFILTNFESTIMFGLQLFPSSDATTSCANDSECPACDVAGAPEVGIAIDNRVAVLAGMPAQDAGSSSVAGATPAAGGMVGAKTTLDAAVANGDAPAIILITDGAANCGLQYADEPCEFPGDGTSASCELMDYFDDQLEPLVAGYASEGIPTYVVGIDIVDEVSDPTSEYNFSPDNVNVYEELNAVAVAGGVPQMGGNESFYNATNEAELQDALSAIAGQVASCDIDLSEAPNTPPEENQIEDVEFFIQNMSVPGPLDITPEECEMGTEDGWIWVEYGISVLFCGTYCDQLKATGEVDGIYGCGDIG